MAKQERRSGRQCPNGHSMDPNWVKCPYCEADKRNQEQSPPPKEVADGKEPTSIGKKKGPAEGRVTKFADAGSNRRIMGVLVTYTWRPEGEMFAVREGKNYIGRGKISSDASHRDCDVKVDRDKSMSQEHALILYRQGIYEIVDKGTTNGTMVNGKMLMTNQSKELGNTAEIKTGDTLWSFIKIGPLGGDRPPEPVQDTGGDEPGPIGSDPSVVR